MVRGHAKQVAQEKSAKKMMAQRKAQNKDSGDDKKTKKAVTCKICFLSMIGEKVLYAQFSCALALPMGLQALRDHYAARHDGKELKLSDYGL